MKEFESAPPPRETYEFVDCRNPEILGRLKAAPVYKKDVLVRAEVFTETEGDITTVTKDGMEETTNTAYSGNWVVTNPSGERYVLTEKMFRDRYESTDDAGVYQSKGYIRAIQNPFARPIEIIAPWGAHEKGESYCFFAIPCSAEGEILDEHPYLIQEKEFFETYKLST